MPKMTQCLYNGKRIDIDQALDLRDDAKRSGLPRPDFRCDECGKPVRAHKAGGHTPAHFEHLERNPECSQSYRRQRIPAYKKMNEAKKPSEDYKEFFESFQNETPRAAVIIGAAFLDVKLFELLKMFMIDDKKNVDQLIGSEKNTAGCPLSSFDARIKASYCLGLIGKPAFHDLKIIRKIRNLFAHRLHDLSFDDPKIVSFCNSLKIPKPFHMITMNSHRDRFVFAVTQLSQILGVRILEIAPEKRNKRKGR